MENELEGRLPDDAAHRPKQELQPRRRWRAVLRILVLLLVLAVSVPLLLGIVYRIDGVRPVSTLMLARAVTLQPVERNWVPLEEIAPVMMHSVIMSEDGRFCGHRGVDWRELNAVIDDALEGEKTRGASTLPMQTAKNLFLWHGRSYIRKAIEIPLALYVDLIWPKRRVLEVYLNVAEWDDGVFGVEAAAQHYFGRSASRLTARQAALLTATLPNPTARNPAKPTAGLNRLAGVIEERARQAGAYVGCLG